LPHNSKSAAKNVAVLLIDFLNPLDFTTDPAFIRRAISAARATRRYRHALEGTNTSFIYVNDHWGNWTESCTELVGRLKDSTLPGRQLVELLAPRPRDYTLLKPRHSAFYGTPLEFLLQDLHVSRLVLTGLATNNCVLFSAHDAYVRGYEIWIPSNCVAAERIRDHRQALLHMRDVLKAKTLPTE